MQKFVEEIIKFNERVLYQGTPKLGKSYTMNELNQLLLFNKIFISNMDELFEKYYIPYLSKRYIPLLSQYIHNVEKIIDLLQMANSRVMFYISNDSFEKRFIINTTLDYQVIIRNFQMVYIPNFKNNRIYYMAYTRQLGYIIAFVEEERSVYKNAFVCKNKNIDTYWKTDRCILDWLEEKFNTNFVELKVTYDKNEKQTKIEYYGDKDDMMKLSSLKVFSDNILIIKNPFLFIDDISQCIDEYIEDNDELQLYKPLDDIDYFNHDILSEFPLNSFNEYLDFLQSVIQDTNTSTIFITLYRVGKDPSIYYILKEAVSRGIQVYVNIELMASGEFDINNLWKREMELAGMNVTTFECGQLKVHCKLTLVVFSDGRSIVQIGTGNYHTKTVTQYTDLSLLTADEEIVEDVKILFQVFNKSILKPQFSNSFLVTQFNLINELNKLFWNEINKGSDGLIIIKCNAIIDERFICLLHKADEVGCNVYLIVRGPCMIKASNHIRVKSIVWDKLEHSRVYSFGKYNPILLIGSLDLVPNKLNKRIETLVKIKDPDIKIQLLNYINRYIETKTGSWIMQRNGKYIKEVENE